MRRRAAILSWVLNHGMIVVLGMLCIVISMLTYSEQFPTGESAGEQVAGDIYSSTPEGATVMIVGAATEEDRAFANQLSADLKSYGFTVAMVIHGQPKDARNGVAELAKNGVKLDVIACAPTPATWLLWPDLATDFPIHGKAKIASPRSYKWPNFLTRRNLLNVANQMAIIAIVAIGMTMVIITAGIDLSVGSLIALSAVVCALIIRNAFGARSASSAGMVTACFVAVLMCGLMGLISGGLITRAGMPPFIVTLAVMLIAKGTAQRLTNGETVYELPDSFIWLGRGSDLSGVPNAVVLMLALYLLAHILMTRMTLGRYLYAVGGNAEAARLSGVPTRSVVLFAYLCSGLLAGLGGIMMASQLKSGSSNFGSGYELQVIAAVVVGGTSLTGGEGSMLGTLIGASIIAVIQNGMNLTNVNPFTQKIVLGMVIIIAVLLDRFKHRANS